MYDQRVDPNELVNEVDRKGYRVKADEWRERLKTPASMQEKPNRTSS
jgi:hypothetical protein